MLGKAPLGNAAKADSTLRTSRAVPHPSTIRALCRLTSEVERDPVHSTRYGRQHLPAPAMVAVLASAATDGQGVPVCVVVASNGKGCRRASYLPQRSLQLILRYGLATAGSTRFCLLCCQPEPMPGILTARTLWLTPQSPCRLSVWLRYPICTRCRTCCAH